MTAGIVENLGELGGDQVADRPEGRHHASGTGDLNAAARWVIVPSAMTRPFRQRTFCIMATISAAARLRVRFIRSRCCPASG
ncbi:hypothetical protein AB0C44_00815 [Micromonospora taraxaci]|uniref:hypothetical protein n=1 Tax=Micromonospora taraxaci TaxID=1316803 RepID=UPI0033CEE3F9